MTSANLQAQLEAQRVDLAALQAREARLEEDLHAVVARVAELELHRTESTNRMDEFSARIGALQSSVDRCVTAVIRQEQASQEATRSSRETTKALGRVESLLEQLVRQQTPSVEVSHG